MFLPYAHVAERIRLLETASRDWNWAVLDLASEVCLPARPRCDVCPLIERCAYASEVA